MRTSTRHIFRVVALATALLLVLPVYTYAAPSVSELRAQLNAINDDFVRAGKKYDEAHWALDETEKQIEDTNSRIGQLEGELAQEQEQLQGRVHEWYRRDDVGLFGFLLAAETFEEFTTRLDYVQRVASSDAETIESVETLLAEVEAERAKLEEQRATREQDVAAFKKQRDKLQADLKKKKAEYERVQAELAAAAAAAARKSKSTSSSKSSGASAVKATAGPVVTGTNGMVFPVAGPSYYSDTWGASRGGGRRRHKGTDIMAATGTPCVATLSGSVQVRNGSSAGLYIVLRADNGLTFYYMHLNSVTVSSGRVQAGQVIGTVGYSGNASASAPHLHYELHRGGSATNPYPYLRAMQGR